VIPIIEEIPLDEFDLSLSGMRIINMTRVIQLEKSMRLYGQLQPVVARVHAGVFTLIDGFKRVYAAENLVMESLQCHLLEIDLQQAKVLLLSYNRSNQSMEAWEEALVLQDLQKTHSLDQRSLARLTGHSPSWVSRRLSLIGKIDEKVSSQFMMGVLTSSHARALTKLPRGNQYEVASAINSWGLTSRQSDEFVDAFLKADNEDQQRYILDHPEQLFESGEPNPEEVVFDHRLSSSGNKLMQSIGYATQSLQFLLSRLDAGRFNEFTQTEKMIITPGFKSLCVHAMNLTEAINQLQTHKSRQEDER